MPIDALIPKKSLVGGIFQTPLTTSLILGCLIGLSLPPFGLFPLLLLALSYVLESIRSYANSSIKAFLICWSLGTGYFITGQYWTTVAFVELFRSHLWLTPVSILVVPLILGFFWGWAGALAYYFRRHSLLLVLIFATALSGVEYLRAMDTFFHYSWNTLGYTLYRLDGLLQLASVVGIYGLSFIVVLLSSLPFLLMRSSQEKYLKEAAWFILTVITLIFLWGEIRLSFPGSYDSNTGVLVLQPDIEQFKKESFLYKEENLQGILATLSAGTQKKYARTIVALPETIFTMQRDESHRLYERIGQVLPPHSLAIVGILQLIPTDALGTQIYNSLMFLDGSGAILATYNKHFLTPWGESLPYKELMEQTFLASLVKNKTPLTAGNRAETIRLEGMPAISPQICYETGYPGYSPGGTSRPDLIVLASNDGLSAGTSQPYQSLLHTRVRSIETGVPQLRAANSGISAIIDSRGRVLLSLGVEKKGTLESALPLADSETFYSRYGDAPFLIFMAMVLATGIFLQIVLSRR